MTQPTEQVTVEVTVNGSRYLRSVPARRTLADFLRDDLSLTGTKLGCEQGVCGACTVLVDGEAVRACLMLAAQATGTEVRTVESLSQGRELNPLQACFQKHHGLQCGFCTAGFLMSATGLLEQRPDADRTDIAETLSGHICRCTGYGPIVDAVDEAARKGQA
jgi:carbon-monoxide dehydrogenase small subunit